MTAPDATAPAVDGPPASRWWADLPRWAVEVLAVIFVIVAGIAMLVPTLRHGTSLGSYQGLRLYGLFQQPDRTIPGFQQGGDQVILILPFKVLAWTQVRSGHLPLWNPFSVMGMPLAFNWESAPFSLQALLGYLGPLRWVYTTSIISTLVIAGTGAYVFARTLRLVPLAAAFAGVTFELCGAMVGFLGWQDAATMAWAGWLFTEAVLILRGHHRMRHITLFALVLALACYEGQPESLFLLVLSLLVFLVSFWTWQWLRGGARRDVVGAVARIGVAGVAGVALAAPLLLPAAQLTGLSVRKVYMPSDNVSALENLRLSFTHGQPLAQALSLHDLTHIVFQSFDGFPVNGGASFGDRTVYIDDVAYIGAVALALAVIGLVMRRRNPVVVALGVSGVAMACLVFVQPVLTVVDHLPVVGTVLWNRAVLPLSFALALLAGFGLDAVVRKSESSTLRRWLVGTFAGLAGGLVILWVAGRGHLPPAQAGIRAHSFIWPAVSTAVGLVTALALALVFGDGHLRRRFGRHAGRWAAGVLLLVDTAFLVTAGAAVWSSSSSRQVIPNTAATAAFTRAVGEGSVGFGNDDCVFPPTLGLKPNLNLLFGVQQFGVYDPMTPLSYFTSWRSVSSAPVGVPTADIFCPAITSAAVARHYGIQFVLEPAHSPGPAGAVFDRALGPDWLYRIPDSQPATLTPLSRPPPGTSLPTATVVSTHRGDPSGLVVSTREATTSLLRLRITDVPGWHATIDGRPLALHPYAHVMLQATVPAGQHLIRLTYWPGRFTIGLALAVCSVLALVLGSVMVRRRRSRGRSPS